MCAKSNNSSRNTALDRPFDPAVWREAQRIAGQYRIMVKLEDGEYYGCAVEMPFVMADGPTPEACIRETLEALAGAVATLLEKGEKPPAAAADEERSEQVNLRVTPGEKYRMLEEARRQGFRGISDFVRTTTLNAINQQQSRWAPPKKATRRKK